MLFEPRIRETANLSTASQKLVGFEAAVVGAGPAGLITGLALARSELQTAVLGPPADPRDGRTAALFEASVCLLKRIGAWPAIAPHAEPLDAIRLIDATGVLFRAPEVTFRASEIGRDAFGYNVPNAVLTSSLETLAAGRIERIVTAGVIALTPGPDAVSLETVEGQVYSAPLVAAADGRQSLGRQVAGIAVKDWHYDQGAVVCSIAHTRPHARVSTEFHRRSGPLTIVPAPGNTANIVWVDTLSEAKRLAAAPEMEFTEELSRHLQGLLGRVAVTSPRRMFQLSGQTAETMARNRIALIGEAAHVIPPIGAQGLNLSFRDAATLAEVATVARATGEDIGGAVALDRYASARRFDVTSRIWTVDLLNRSLLSEYAPVHALRGVGLFALKTLAPLRQRLMREGIAPSHDLPKLMQPVLERQV